MELLDQGKSVLPSSVYEELDPDKPALFHGDLHGDAETVFNIWKNIPNLSSFQLVFLGDYVDRGPQQVEVFLLVLSLKAKDPERVVVLRGNREVDPSQPVYPNDYSDSLVARCGQQLGKELYKLSLEVFSRMPLYAIYGKYLGLHGGPPLHKIRYCKGLPCLQEKNLKTLEAVLWSDPDELLGLKVCAWEDGV